MASGSSLPIMKEEEDDVVEMKKAMATGKDNSNTISAGTCHKSTIHSHQAKYSLADILTTVICDYVLRHM